MAEDRRRQRFDTAMRAEPVDRRALAELAWKGVPAGLSRAEVWQLLLGYRPLARERRLESLQRKRQEYRELRRNFYDASPAVQAAAQAAAAAAAASAAANGPPGGSTADAAVASSSSSVGPGNAVALGAAAGRGSTGSEAEVNLLVQLRKDMPRTKLRFTASSPALHLAQHPRVQALMERVLFVWAVRQPASGYWQGLSDVLLVLLLVSLLDTSGRRLDEIGIELVERLSDEQLEDIEADCYWCAVKIFSEIYDHYTQDFPGLQRMAQQLREILRRIDPPLLAHLEAQQIDIFHSTFQWMACLMVRDLPLGCCMRLWDTLIAESSMAVGLQSSTTTNEQRSAGFEVFLLYFCACFTASYSKRFREMDFEAMMRFVQPQMPTDSLSEEDVDVLVSEAFVLKSLFQNAPQHLSAPAAKAGAEEGPS